MSAEITLGSPSEEHVGEEENLQLPSSSEENLLPTETSGENLQLPAASEENLQSAATSEENLQLPAASEENVQPTETSGESLQLPGASEENLQPTATSGENLQLSAAPEENLQPPRIPEASQEALNFLQSIVPEEDFKYLMFDDALVTVSDTGKELGEFTVTMEPAKYRGQECFLVHANSHGAVDGVPCGTSIVCHVAKNMDTLEQHHHEYVKLENCPLDRRTIITKTNESYVINRVITQGEDVQRTSRSIPLEAMKGFISEGSNLLLHRLFMERGPQEELEFISFDSETNLCPTVYRSLEERTQSVEGVEIHVNGVERTINSSVDLPTTWQSYFMRDGHLTNRVQIGSPVTMKLIHLPSVIERDEQPQKPVFGKKPLNWAEDMQMYSKFLDRKKELKGDHAVYMRHHPELRALLADFLQFLLLRKPQDVIAFAADYFAAFSPTMPVPTPYLSSTPSPFPHSHTNAQIESLRASTH